MFANRKARRRAEAFARKSGVQRKRVLSATLVNSVVVGAVGTLSMGTASAQVTPGVGGCIISGTTVTCTGDLSTGVYVDGPAYDMLKVNTVDAPGITPAATVDGIFFVADDGNNTVSVDTTGTDGISTTGNFALGILAGLRSYGNLTVVSTGSISTEGENAEGIYGFIDGDGSMTITSTGNIYTASDGSEGIIGEVDGKGDVTISSTGNISSYEGGILGLTNDDGSVKITNMGDISTKDSNADGIHGEVIGSGKVTISSTGNISTMGDGAEGIFGIVGGNGDVIIMSSGDIATAGDDSAGIYGGVTGDGDVTITSMGAISSVQDVGISARVVGSGTITINTTGSVSGTKGIQVSGRTASAPATITNSGTIIGTGGTAIDLQDDGHDVVNLLAGTSIVGAIDFGNGNDGMGGTNADDIDTLNVASGVNAFINFADTSGTDDPLQSAPENITLTGGAGLLINGGTTLVTVDPTGFAAQTSLISDILKSTFNVLDNDPPGSDDSAALAYQDTPFQTVLATHDHQFWTSGFGAIGSTPINGTLAAYGHRFGGILSGVNTGSPLDDLGMFGVFGGATTGNVVTEGGGSNLDTNTVFGGAVWKRDYMTHRVNFTLAGGGADNQLTRQVNGMAANGNFASLFFAPSLTVLAPVEIFPVPVNVSGRISYVGMFNQGYTETGTAPGLLTIDGRYADTLDMRGQISLPQLILRDNGDQTYVEWRTGVDARIGTGADTINASVAGTPFSFNAQINNAFVGFVGLDINHYFADSPMSLTLSSELQAGLDGSVAARAEMRANAKF